METADSPARMCENGAPEWTLAELLLRAGIEPLAISSAGAPAGSPVSTRTDGNEAGNWRAAGGAGLERALPARGAGLNRALPGGAAGLERALPAFPHRLSRFRAGVARNLGASLNVPISSITDDSRKVSPAGTAGLNRALPGACFVAVRGTGVDGHDFIDRAIAAGASAIIAEREIPAADGVTIIRVADSREAIAKLAAAYFGLRDERTGKSEKKPNPLRLIGVTGTNGKTTVAWLIRSILHAAREKAALFGTVEYDLVGRKLAAPLTTPDPMSLCQLLSEAQDAGATYAVMEVSSHALDQRRCDGLAFAAGVFTNLTGDHLDYHGSMDAYFAAKRRLFESLNPDAIAVVNLDDPRADELIHACRAKVLTYSLNRDDADIRARVAKMDRSGTTIELTLPSASGTNSPRKKSADTVWRLGGANTGDRHSRFEPGDARTPVPHLAPLAARFDKQEERRAAAGEIVIRLGMVGMHNVSNALAAAGAALAMGVASAAVIAGLERVHGVPGRLERVDPAEHSLARAPAFMPGGTMSTHPTFSVFVDYAHTDDALENVLRALRPITTGQILCVFGCGGNRDRGKRPRMAAVVERLADVAFVTSDNPRKENPNAIIDDILSGFSDPTSPRIHVDVDRRSAIAAAIAAAQPGDTVLIAGKGHENYQLVGDQVLTFDDAAVACEQLARLAMSKDRPAAAAQAMEEVT